LHIKETLHIQITHYTHSLHTTHYTLQVTRTH